MYKNMQIWSRGSAVFQTKCQNFDRRMTDGARQGGLSISETADLLEFSQRSIEFAENAVKNKKTSSEQQFCGQKRVVNERG